MGREVTIIEPTKQFRFGSNCLITTQKRRVAAYCRVSSEKDEQLNSFENQVEEWTRRLSNDPSIEFVGIYSDEGISGTTDEKRYGFLRMLEDCKKGLIDKIYTKSISRFARNTADSINTARDLKAIGVEVYFDNDHISTFDPQGEIMFTIGSLMAQEESRHISDNVKWTFHKMFQEGIPMVSSNLLGYRRDPNNKKNLIIVPEEAEIVKEIYALYTSGVGPCQIARILTSKGYKTRSGKSKWHDSTIEGVLQNEKYCGDLILQKTVTPDFLTHKRVINDGIAHKYHIKDNHEPIIDRETWEKAQQIRRINKQRFQGMDPNTRKYVARYPFSGIVLCGDCGRTYKRRQWIQGYPEPRIVYQCNGFISGEIGKRCKNKSISEDMLKKISCDVINNIYSSKKKVFKAINEIISETVKIDGVLDKIEKLELAQADIEKELDAIISQKAKATTDVEQDILDRKYRNNMNEYSHIESEISLLRSKQENIEATNIRVDKMKEVLSDEEITPDMLTQVIIQTFIQNIIVVDKNNVVVVIATTKNGNNKEIAEHRKEIIDSPALLENTIHVDRPFRPEKVHYKVVVY